MKETVRLTVADLDLIRCDEHEGFDVVTHEVTGTWRHGTEEKAIVKRLSDQKFFAVTYRDSVKESCDFIDMNDDGEFTEVFPREKTITVYE